MTVSKISPISSPEKYAIESNVPQPGFNIHSIKYPFAEMQIGDSFAFSTDEFGAIQAAAYAYGKSHNMKFSVRAKHLRVWRIA